MKLQLESNIDDVILYIEKLHKRGQDLAPLFAEIANELSNRAETAFEDEISAFDGEDWAELATSTIKQKKGRGRKLQHTGHMKDNLHVEHDADSAVIGLNAVSKDGYTYPAVHQFGTDDGKVPARPFLPFEDGDISDDLRDDLRDMVFAHFDAYI